MHAGCLRETLVAALAEHGTVMRGAMHQELQTLVAPAAQWLQQVAPASVTPGPVPQFRLAQAEPAASHPADAAPVAALQLDEQRQQSEQPDVQVLASAVHCSDMPSQAVQQRVDTAEEQVDPTQQRCGALGKQTPADVAQAVLHAPQLHASMVSRVPETAPAQLPPPSAPHEAHDSGASAAASGAGERPALLMTYSRTVKRRSSSSAEAVHPDTASTWDSKWPRHGDTGANPSSPPHCKLRYAQDVHSCRFLRSCHAAAFLCSPCLWPLRARDAQAQCEERVDRRARGVCAEPAFHRSDCPATQAAHAGPLRERHRAGALPHSLRCPFRGPIARHILSCMPTGHITCSP